MFRQWILAVLALGLCASAHAGDIYQCKNKQGVTVFQDLPCPKTTTPISHSKFRTVSPSWRAAEAAFVRAHPDIARSGNVAIMQRAIDRLQQPNLSNLELLQKAYVKARVSPGWNTRQSSSRGAVPRHERVRTAPTSAGGLGISKYGRGELVGMKCTRPNGTVYYAQDVCGSSPVQTASTYTVTDPQTGRVVARGLDHRTGTILDNETGRYLEASELNWRSVPTYRQVPDKSQRVNVDRACDEAQAYAASHPSHAADARVEALCQQGRSLYETRPSRGSLYYTPSN